MRDPETIRAEMARVAANLHAANVSHARAEADEEKIMIQMERVDLELQRTTRRVEQSHMEWDALYDELCAVQNAQIEAMVQA